MGNKYTHRAATGEHIRAEQAKLGKLIFAARAKQFLKTIQCLQPATDCAILRGIKYDPRQKEWTEYPLPESSAPNTSPDRER